MLASSLASTPLRAGRAQADPAPVQVDSASWTKPDPAMDNFLTDLMAKMTLKEKIGQLSLLTSDWDSTGDRKSTRLNSSHPCATRMPSSACTKKHLDLFVYRRMVITTTSTNQKLTCTNSMNR